MQISQLLIKFLSSHSHISR